MIDIPMRNSDKIKVHNNNNHWISAKSLSTWISGMEPGSVYHLYHYRNSCTVTDTAVPLQIQLYRYRYSCTITDTTVPLQIQLYR